ncbi:MAG TPA: hypothetical protein PK431_10270 [Chitinophagales bacterium]|nr:hypothetical protein [Chitinophagales bacterium]
MFDTKLIQTYISLNKEEKRKIKKWMSFQLVNENYDVFRLFNFIVSRKKIDAKSVTKLKVHQYLYPKKPFNDLRIRHLIWMTTELVESFIVSVSTDNKIGLKEKLLTDFYMHKGLLSFANHSIDEANQLIEKESLRNAAFYRDSYDLGITYYDINSRNNRTKDFNINQTIYSFTAYTIIEVLKSACIVSTIQRVMDFKDQQFLLPSVLELLPNSEFLQIPIVRIYYNTFLFVSNDDVVAFETFLKDIQQNESLFSFYDLNNLYRTAINFCIKKSNQNIEYYTKKTFELYIYTIKKAILIEDNELNRFAFTNTVSVGIKLKEFDKLNDFVKRFSSLISKTYQNNTIDFNTAKLLYATNQSDKALKILLTNEFKDTLWNLNAKFLVLKILFEKRDFELFDVHFKAFKTYIRRQKNIGYHKNYFSNVCQAFSVLVDADKHPIKYKNYIFEKETPDFDWFNKTINDLIKTKKLRNKSEL